MFTLYGIAILLSTVGPYSIPLWRGIAVHRLPPATQRHIIGWHVHTTQNIMTSWMKNKHLT